MKDESFKGLTTLTIRGKIFRTNQKGEDIMSNLIADKSEWLKKELHYYHKETGIFMPNEIFDDLQKETDSFNHASVAYSFYYLYSYLWRYAKFAYNDFNVKKIKTILGFNENTKSIDHIIKKGGMLDKIKYTESVNDYPIKWSFDLNEGAQFVMLSETELKPRVNSRQKFPLKGYYRTEEKNILNGVFYDIANTHLIRPSVFIKCMSEEKLKWGSFYIYGKIQSKMYAYDENRKWFISRESFSKELNIKIDTLFKYTDALEEFELIKIDHRDYKNNPERLANGYRTSPA